jgi:hypothetical protein
MKRLKISINNDGIDHINVYSKGRTYLGRLLSNFSYSPIKTEDGDFISIEGYWYWLLCKNPNKDQLRLKFGKDAKELGRQLGSSDWESEEESKIFREKIIKALRLKVKGNLDIQSLLKKNSLPFVHYYVYKNKVKNVPGCNWFLDEFVMISKELKELN